MQRVAPCPRKPEEPKWGSIDLVFFTALAAHLEFGEAMKCPSFGVQPACVNGSRFLVKSSG